MPPKAKMPAPIDRPLSRAYLREFSGWSTAYPPGVSEPTSLRLMENMQINREGSIRVRPGLRYLSFQEDGTPLDTGLTVIGTFEPFYVEGGGKAYLFAVREDDDTVGFRAALVTGDPAMPLQVYLLNDPEIGFPEEAIGFEAATTYVTYLQIDNKILALNDTGEVPRIFWVGTDKRSRVISPITRPNWTHSDKPLVYQPNQDSINNPASFPAESNNVGGSRTSATLQPPVSDAADVPYNIGYYYTFSNELGESAPSQIVMVKVRRPWSAWRWETANAAAEPSGTETQDPDMVSDQLIIYAPELTYYEASGVEGATHFNVYAIMWSDQDPVPVEGMLIGSRDLSNDPLWENSWVRHSPAPYDFARPAPIPTQSGRYNYSDPSRAAQGIVASDRLVLVYDSTNPAVVRWTSNRLGENLNFTSSRGGGYKTLTSGNLYIPACVKLWQNPQSADTLTILCLGTDGRSTGYYMAPAQVASQSDATNVMGFEETTATQGTSSPFGCEVMNNSLFHPLETELTKSTASNYNINHKSMTDLIANKWKALEDKIDIVSGQLDNRLYYIVHNPDGEELEEGCRGNEIWVMDGGKKEGNSWSRWLIQAHTLRTIEIQNQLYMAIVRPEGIYCLDDAMKVDQYVETSEGELIAVEEREIPWKFETNTQGANRAHDAWAHLQQLNVTLGNFIGKLRFGVRGWDLQGREVDISKISGSETAATGETFDFDDYLLVRRDMKEWVFYAESVVEGGEVQHGEGQVSLVQYRYTPVTVNVGYEYGSVETFEYQSAAAGNAVTTVNGVPIPMVDGRRP